MTTQTDQQTATLRLPDREVELPLIVGTEDETALDISKLRGETGVITLDEGLRNTGSCRSGITFIDAENGILRYRGIPIEEVAKGLSFIETALLLIYGQPPTDDRLTRFRRMLTDEQMIHEGLRNAFDAFPPAGTRWRSSRR